MTPQELQQKIFELFNLGSLPTEQQGEMLGRIVSLAFQGLMMEATEKMTDAQVETIDTMMQDPESDPGKLVEYLQANVPNYDQLLNDQLTSIKMQMDEIPG